MSRLNREISMGKKDEIVKELSKKYSHVIIPSNLLISGIIQKKISKSVKYKSLGLNSKISGVWLIPKKFQKKAKKFAEEKNLRMEEISYILKIPTHSLEIPPGWIY
ncbi:MAG: hypothetical protein PHR68_00650 [Candidatus Gracilibacteria bacterium]|nr:hypothetical protein [Candidatus Gracilibacteria bacterium]